MKKYCALCVVLILTACAGSIVFRDGFGDEKTWAEVQAQLPNYPEPENLLPFDIRSVSNNHYYIDAASIQIGENGVIYYTLVIKSLSGAINVSFEGLRCATKERKRYASGRNDNTWSQSQLSGWQLLENVTQTFAQLELFQYYFCPFQSIVSSTAEAIHALKAGVHPKIRALYQ